MTRRDFIRCAVALATVPVFARGEQVGIQRAAFKRAIAQRESSNNPLAYNPKGPARGRYQFTIETWVRYHSTFDAASVSEYEERIADEHVYYLTSRLFQRQLTPTVARLANAWRYGPDSAQVNKSTPYSRKVEEYYLHYLFT